LASLGKTGLQNVARASYNRAHILQEKLRKNGFDTINTNPFYNEFLVKSPRASEKVIAGLMECGIFGGIDVGDNKLLVCCTEKNSLQDIDSYISAVNK
jgi:glycine dehydrogenase subunit 1